MADEVDPWRFLVTRVFDRLNDDDAITVLSRYRHEGTEVETEGKDLRQRFYETVDSCTDKVQAARQLQKVFKDLQLHTDMGKDLSETVEQNIDKIAKYHQQFVVESLEKFVGRDKEVEFLMGIFKDSKPKVSGMCICGIGGQGKSTLARHVCYQLIESKSWNIIKADLRNFDSITDVLKAILAAAGLMYSMHAEEKKLQEILVSFVEGSTRQGLDEKSITMNTLFFLDNCDLVPLVLFRAFVQNILRAASQRTDDIKVYFLFTMHQKFENKREEYSSTPWYHLKLDNLLMEMELKALTQTDAVELLAKSSSRDIEDDLAADIVKECAYSPLAITVVADLIKDGGKYQPDRLLFHLKMDKKNVTKQLKVDTCIQQAITNLTKDELKAIVSLSVFQSSPFEFSSAGEILAGCFENKDNLEVNNILQKLHNKHLLDVELLSNNTDRNKYQFSLQPLVYRFISEWQKTKDLDLEYKAAVKKFMVLYEKIIGNIMRNMDTKYWKASRKLEMHKVHILNFYTIMSENPKLLGKYSKESKEKDFLSKKRISDLSDLMLSLVQKRRIFSDRALEVGNDAMYIFWMVEKADVFVLLHDKSEIAMEIIDDITNGRFPALRGLHAEPFYAPIVHALFHKVKGLCHWKQHHLDEAISHLELALKFYERYPEPLSAWYSALKARVYRYIGQVYIDKGNLDEAEQNFVKGMNMVKAIIKVPDKSEKSNFDKERQWDVPMYYYHFAYIKYEKAKGLPDAERNELYESALADLDRGMKLDKWLQMDNLNGYYTKMKLKVDITIEKGNLAEALTEAEFVLQMRRIILQPPHTCYTESIYQVGRIYMLIGNEWMSKGDKEKALKFWNNAFDYFDELSQHHLKNGGIALTNPTYQGIKRDHYKITKLVKSDKDLKRLSMFYMKLERGDFNKDKQSSIKEMKSMLWTPMEMIYKFFGGGGKEFGDKDADLDKLQSLESQQITDMMTGGTSGGPRHDSGHGHSSSDFSDSFSSGSGSMSKKMANMKLNKSLSLEDDVFEESKEAPAENISRKNQLKKRQKTIDESVE